MDESQEIEGMVLKYRKIFKRRGMGDGRMDRWTDVQSD
jgi:hypothetical protein